ncbi:MAG: phage protein Gp36 family protein [Deferribacterales bacterium]
MYCSIDDIKKYLDSEVVDQVVAGRPGLIESHIEDVSGEIDDHLRGRYVLPISVETPAVINRCCAVLVAYRTLGGITGVMDTDKTTENALMYLQKQAASVDKILANISEGKMRLGLAEAQADSGTTDNELLTSTRPQTFNFEGY